jgi:tRNA-splicing ligase RtcB
MAKKKREQPSDESVLRSDPLPYPIWGKDQIDAGALEQMEAAMRLPISVAGALMPDAHIGYGLPIGGVLATEGAVIPYAVGVDIACRVRLTVFPVSPIVIGQKTGQFKKALMEQTNFGTGGQWRGNMRADHDVLDDPAWNETKYLRSLIDTAHVQLGTSGSGNHFCEFGALELDARDDELDLDKGKYLALLSHSGSRGVGFKIANHYSKIAMELHPELDKKARHLAWLPLDWHDGRAYWISMELAGRYASANHEVIHKRLAKAIGFKPAAVVENHHNFAWKETIPAPDGFSEPEREVIVHRKGATPAGAGVYGFIPGSMADPGFLVRGRGDVSSINSAAHGAGRQMGRKQALRSITKTERDKYLKERAVQLLGAGLDESPQAYKRIEDVMAAQSDLVDVVAKFTPMLVRMSEDKGYD